MTQELKHLSPCINKEEKCKNLSVHHTINLEVTKHHLITTFLEIYYYNDF